MGRIAFDRTHGGTAASGALIDFSISINPFGPPPAVLDAYHRAVASISSYPEPYAASLTAAIAESLGVAPANILAGNGSTQLIHLIARVLRPLRPVVQVPTFSEIANSLLTQSLQPAPIFLRREKRFQLDIDAVHEAIAAGADALLLGRPNSPTGTTISIERMTSIARRCAASRCWCVIDEAFIDFADEPASAAALVQNNDRIIVVRSMTKFYAIPGLRLGYVVAAEHIVSELARALEPWSVSGPAAAVGAACLKQPESWREEIRDALRRERLRLESGLAAVGGFEVFPSAANFIMFAAPAASRSFPEYMGQHGIAVRDLSALPGAGPGLYRVGVRSRADNDRLLEAARTYF
jgi:threonine-phosphate decarboxylase